ncbi:MAG: hypothetical protein WCH07_06430 [Deltaproteobacteria bacterium]
MTDLITSLRLAYTKLPKPVKKIARPFLRPIYKYRCSFILRRFCAEFHEGWILVCPASLGDLFMVCSLAKAFRDQYDVDKLIIIGSNDWSSISSYFESIDEYRVCQAQTIEAAYHGGLSYPIPRPRIPFNAYPKFKSDEVAFVGYKGISQLDYFKARLGLSLHSSYTPPRSLLPSELDQGREYLRSRGLREGKTVLINPFGQSVKSFSWQRWIGLANHLRKRGYDILWSYHQPKPCPPEIEGNDIPLGMMRAVAVCCGFVITIACGLSVLLAFDPATHLSLIPRRSKLDDLLYYNLVPRVEMKDFVECSKTENIFPTSTAKTVIVDENDSYDDWLSQYL